MNRYQISGLLVAGTVLTAAGLLWRSFSLLNRERRAEIEAIVAVELNGDGVADALKLYAPGEHDERSLLEAVDPVGGEVLWTRLSDPIQDTARDGVPAVETDELIILAWAPQVRLEERVLHTQARRKQDGTLVWAAGIRGRFDALPPIFRCGLHVIRSSLSRDKQVLYLTAYEASSGRERWEVELPSPLVGPRCLGDGVWLSAAGGGVFVDREGTALPVQARGLGGPGADGVHFVHPDGPEIRVRSLDGSTTGVAAFPEDLAPELQIGWQRDAVITFAPDRRELALVGWGGRPGWRVPLDGRYPHTQSEWPYKLADPPWMPRQLMVLVTDGEGTRLQTVDTRDGSTTWRSRAIGARIGARYLFYETDLWWFPLAYGGDAGGAWLGFDGEDGRLLGGFELTLDGRPLAPKHLFPRPGQLRDGRLYLHVEGIGLCVELATGRALWNEAPGRLEVRPYDRSRATTLLGPLPVELASDGAQ